MHQILSPGLKITYEILANENCLCQIIIFRTFSSWIPRLICYLDWLCSSSNLCDQKKRKLSSYLVGFIFTRLGTLKYAPLHIKWKIDYFSVNRSQTPTVVFFLHVFPTIWTLLKTHISQGRILSIMHYFAPLFVIASCNNNKKKRLHWRESLISFTNVVIYDFSVILKSWAWRFL